jgi:hypothetical protein
MLFTPLLKYFLGDFTPMSEFWCQNTPFPKKMEMHIRPISHGEKGDRGSSSINNSILSVLFPLQIPHPRRHFHQMRVNLTVVVMKMTILSLNIQLALIKMVRWWSRSIIDLWK